jgi:hypothetical protein
MWPTRPFYCHAVHLSAVVVGDFHGGQQLATSLAIGPSSDVLDASRALGPYVIRLRYIDRLDRINLSLRKELIRAAVDYILQESAQLGEAIQIVGNDWVTRFIERYGYIIIK